MLLHLTRNLILQSILGCEYRMQDNKTLWEILVPGYSNQGKEYELDYHKEWDKQVRGIAGGLTVLKTAKGQWISLDDKLFVEKMIPVRIHCTENQIDKIIQITMKHYNQEAVLAYEISSNVKLVYKAKT